jgi:hypothetical protein
LQVYQPLLNAHRNEHVVRLFVCQGFLKIRLILHYALERIADNFLNKKNKKFFIDNLLKESIKVDFELLRDPENVSYSEEKKMAKSYFSKF